MLLSVGDLQADNAALKVKVSTLEQEKEDDNGRMQDIMQENAQLSLERDRKYKKGRARTYFILCTLSIKDIEALKQDLDKLRTAKSSSKTDGEGTVKNIINVT